MNLEQVKVLVKASTKIFIWSSLSPECGAYFPVSKAALSDYLNTITTDGDFLVEMDELGDLYLGCPAESSH
jgi:hypothetical protein